MVLIYIAKPSFASPGQGDVNLHSSLEFFGLSPEASALSDVYFDDCPFVFPLRLSRSCLESPLPSDHSFVTFFCLQVPLRVIRKRNFALAQDVLLASCFLHGAPVLIQTFSRQSGQSFVSFRLSLAPSFLCRGFRLCLVHLFWNFRSSACGELCGVFGSAVAGQAQGGRQSR